ncbi:MAG: twin-arginine translocase TatA/TatE family subunit [Pyrinomonadaceae bacterium]
MLLFIFESLGTAELLLIGMVALIIFGPRKLPELARKAGKLMNEFRKISSDFKDTWEKEVALEDDEKNAFDFSERSIARTSTVEPLGIEEFDVPIPSEEQTGQASLATNTSNEVPQGLEPEAAPNETASASDENPVQPQEDSKANWL